LTFLFVASAALFVALIAHAREAALRFFDVH
jgi:hypothetical protein